MKLSEAMKLGSLLRPQGFWGFLKDGKSCALGAAMEAVGVPIEDGETCDPLVSVWSLLIADAHCPQCDLAWSLGAVITHLNDDHKWTREAIADWIAVFERSGEPATVDALPCAVSA